MNEIVDIKYFTNVRIRDLQNNIDQLVKVEKKSLSETPWVIPQTVATTVAEVRDDIAKPFLTRKRLCLTSEHLKILSERTTDVKKRTENFSEF